MKSGKRSIFGRAMLAAFSACVLAGSAGAAAPQEPANAASPKRLRLLTTDQYINTLSHLFGRSLELRTQFAAVLRVDGLIAAGTSSAGLSSAQIEQYQKMATLVANEVTGIGRRDVLIPCKPARMDGADNACATRFLGDVSRLLYRRKLDDAHLNEFVAQANQAADKLQNFYSGLAIALEGLLLSPNVLLVADVSEPDPAHPGAERLDAYSLASRISLFLWNSAPDDTLLKAAESGELMTSEGRTKAVDRMLASPRLEVGVRAFFDDMLMFDDFNTLFKDPMIYPSFTGVTAVDAREQTLRTIVDLLLKKQGDYRDLFTTRETYISPALAGLYGLPSKPTWMRYEFPEGGQRAGLLTQISFLAAHSHPGRSSPTLRGKALREIFLCQPVPRPPPNVDFSAVENPDPSVRTARDRLDVHQKNPACAGCHKITDPMGLALEKFDGAGQFRETEKGATIDINGSLDGRKFTDVIGLGQALHDHPALPRCLVKRLYAYGTGGPTSSEDNEVLAYFSDRFAQDGYRLPDLMRSIVLSSVFSEVRQPAKALPELTASK